MLNPNLNLLSLSLQMLKCMFLILRGIVMKKRLVFLGKAKVKELLKNFMLKNQCLYLVLSIKENLNIFLLVTIMVWLVTLDPIVCSWDLNLKSKLNWLQESKVDLSSLMFVTTVVFLVTLALAVSSFTLRSECLNCPRYMILYHRLKSY